MITATGTERVVMTNEQLQRHQHKLRLGNNDEKEIFKVIFEKERNVPTFSQMLCDLSQKNTTFSPDFSRMLQVDMTKNQFSIYDV